MYGLAFFLAGLPLVLIANRLVIDLTSYEEEVEDEPADEETAPVERRVLPWQTGAWPDRVRWGVVLLLPPLLAVAGERFDLLQALAISLLVLALLICTATDLLRFRVPNIVTYPGIALALIAAVLMPNGDVADALVAALIGGGLFFVLSLATNGGIGLGDAKLAALIGAALGLRIAYQALLVGVTAAAVVMLAMLFVGVITRKQPVPYAPFLSLAAIAVVLIQGSAFAPL